MKLQQLFERDILDQYEDYLDELPSEDLVDELFDYNLQGEHDEESWGDEPSNMIIDILVQHMNSSPKDLQAWATANQLT